MSEKRKNMPGKIYGRKSTVGVLLLHGFAGSREEVDCLYRNLKEQGYLIEMPLLPGHGGNRDNLKAVKYQDWISCAELAFLKLSRNCEQVIVVGFSMGGLLALNLWQMGPEAMVLINTPIYYWNFAQISKNIILNFPQSITGYISAGREKPVSAMLQFQCLLSRTKPLVSKVKCRTLIIQARDDDTVYHKSADYLIKRLSCVCTLCKLERGGHQVLAGPWGAQINQLVRDFIPAQKK